MQTTNWNRRWQRGNKAAAERGGTLGYVFLWLLGVPLPILAVIFLLRGCN